MPKPEIEFCPPDAAWRRPEGSLAEGIDEQILSADADGGSYTRLLRFEPGADSSPNGVQVHDFWEEVYIIEGDITDLRLNETFTDGMYACRPPGMDHGPWKSEEGALMVEFRYGFPG
jgi:ChrR Cupin-like domain